MIQLDNVCCGYGKTEILNNISCYLSQGELTCMLGKNGVGKTTLFKTILGLQPVISGKILYNGKSISNFSVKDFAKFISYVPQAHNTPFPFTVLDVVLMGQYVHTSNTFGRPQQTNIDFAIDCLQTLDIEYLSHKNFSKISGGEKQMVLIARAMAQKPQFIAMDEPTANLDMGNQVRVMKLARSLTQKGYGIIMNTHSPQHALQYADKVIMLYNQTNSITGNPSEVICSQTISQLYGTPVEFVETYTQKGNKQKVLITL